MYLVRRQKIGQSELLDSLARAAGELYTRTLLSFWRVQRKKGIWLSASNLMRLHTSAALHAHTADAVVQAFRASVDSWQSRRRCDPAARPPHRLRRFFVLRWKSSAIRRRGEYMVLSNGNRNTPLAIHWPWDLPKQVEIGWDGSQYELRAVYPVLPHEKPLGSGVAGVDLGEIHLAAAHDGQSCALANGRLLRSKRRYQNKLKGKLARRISRKKKHSRRWKRLAHSKRYQIRRIQRQIGDILHKQTTRLVSMLHANGVQTVVIGDMRNIRREIDYGTHLNERLHQMLYGATRRQLAYKAERRGMVVRLQDEAYTSQTCPACRARRKPIGRRYACACGFTCHREAVGSWNIRQAYLGSGPVVGVMASPIGLRFTPHARCSSPAVR